MPCVQGTNASDLAAMALSASSAGSMASRVQDHNGIWWRAACLLPTCSKSVSFPPQAVLLTRYRRFQVGKFQPPEQHEALFLPLWPNTHLTGLTARFRDDDIHIREL